VRVTYSEPKPTEFLRQAGFALALPGEYAFTGDKSVDEEDDDAPWLDENYPYEPPTGEVPSPEDLMLAGYDLDEWEDEDDLPF
jgi:hypothetical protein